MGAIQPDPTRQLPASLAGRLSLDSPIVRALYGSGVLGVLLVLLALVVGLVLGPAEQQVAINFFVSLIAVVGFQVYSGNSGIMTFGHVAFMGIGAYAAALLTVAPAIKGQSLPNLAPWLRDVQLPLIPAMIAALVVVGVVAFVFGYPISRLSAAATPISTLAMLMITYVVLVGAADVTRGSQTFFGVPSYTDLGTVVVFAILAIIVARLFRESVPGLRVRASREDELAAASMGVNVRRLRLFAWMLGALIVGVAGVLLAHNLTAFSPKQFYFTLQFALVAMLVVGGPTTVTGAVGGSFLVAILIEAARRLEGVLTGFSVGPIYVEHLFGLQEIALGLVILAVMFRRRDGLFGRLEVDEVLTAWWRRRAPRNAVPAGAAASPTGRDAAAADGDTPTPPAGSS
jgi:branched-chain amino acid transport system permease protein